MSPAVYGVSILTRIFFLLAVSMLLSCASGGFSASGGIGRDDSEAMDWAFIQSVGGIRLGDPYVNQGIRWVPIFVDVSGTQTITIPPTLRNTGLVCSAVSLTWGGSNAATGGMEFWLTVYTQPISSVTAAAGLSSRCADLPLNFRDSFGGSTVARFYYTQTPATLNVFNSRENMIGVLP